YLKDGDGDGNSQPHKGVKASANSDVMYFFTSAQDGDPSQDDWSLIKNTQSDVWGHGLVIKECGRRVKKDDDSRVNENRKSTQDKVRRKKMFEVDEAIDGENSMASSFQVRGMRGQDS
ncbi:hypothetical protein Tco_0127134, partial [Tanacetum coccineum]